MPRIILRFLIATITFAGVPLWATTDVNTCVPDTLQDYLNTTCEVGRGTGGILVFGGFGFSSTGTTDLTASGILVTPVQIGEGGGFNFSGFTGFTVPAGQEVTYEIDYSYLIDPGPVVSGNDLGMDPVTGNVNITEYICTDPFFPITNLEVSQPVCTSTQSLSVDNTNPPASWTNHLDLDPVVQNNASVRLVFDLVGADPASGFDGVTATNTVVDPVPEPAPVVLVALGLPLCFLLKRRTSTR